MYRCPAVPRGIPAACAAFVLAVAPLGASAAGVSVMRAPAMVPPAVVASVPRAAVRDAGRAPAQTVVRLAVALQYRDPAGLDAFVRAVSDARSPLYRRFLTLKQFTDAFAPSPAAYAQSVAALQRLGLTVTRTYATRTLIDVAAPAAVVERAFSTELHAVEQPGVGRRYANARPGVLPAELRGATRGIVGFDNLVMKTHHVRAARLRRDTALGPPLYGPDNGLGPFALAAAYDYPVQHVVGDGPATYDGTGHGVGIVIDSDVADSDVDGFLSVFNISRTGPPLARVPVDGGSATTFDDVETALDTEIVSALAPGAAVYLYLIPDLSDASVIDAYTQAVADDAVDVVSSSFGGCEVADNGALGTMADGVAVQGAALGITFAASSGDAGADTCAGYVQNGVGVSEPASAPHVTAVGGTTLHTNADGSYRSESGWIGSGGGVSVVFPMPAYQAGIAGTTPGGRNVPDVAFDADPVTGPSLFLNGGWIGPIGGTSVASPMFAALTADVDQYNGTRNGFANPNLYAVLRQTRYMHFHDVVAGGNAFSGPGYGAGAGYDLVTGIGSPTGWPLGDPDRRR